jgi:hypothetical protein
MAGLTAAGLRRLSTCIALGPSSRPRGTGCSVLRRPGRGVGPPPGLRCRGAPGPHGARAGALPTLTVRREREELATNLRREGGREGRGAHGDADDLQLVRLRLLPQLPAESCH